MREEGRHPWMVAAGNVLLVLAIYTATRLFCLAVNGSMFPDISGGHLWEILRGGVRFDLTAVLYLSALYIIGILLPLPATWRNNKAFQQMLYLLFVIPNAVGIVVNTIDMVYIRFTDRRTTCTFFQEFQNDTNLWRIAGEGVIDYWYVTLFGIAMLALLVGVSRRRYVVRENNPNPIVFYARETAIFILTIYLSVIGIRGGFGRYTRPITISNAAQYTNTPRETALVLNTPFSLMKSIENTRYIEPDYFSPEQLPQHMTPVIPAIQTKAAALQTGDKPVNIVVIILESFSSEYIGFYNRDKSGYTGYTPFLDSLLAESVTYRYSFASGRKSIDAMPSILSAIPMLIEPYIVTPYSTNAVSSIADCLKRKGYTTAFFHGAPNGSMGFQAYARSAGFDRYYGMNEFGDRSEYDGTWAIWDEPFLQYYAQTMSGMQEPFMTAVFTASSHHPFKLPAPYKHRFPQGTKPIHATIGYTDYALRRFFETASRQPWYANTLFVITADHTNELSRPEYTNAKGLYQIPIAFFHPESSLSGECRDEVISQTDIMPSVLSYVHYDKPYIAFGENALTCTKYHPYAVCYNAPVFQIFSDSMLVQFDGERVTAVYDYRQDPCLGSNIASTVAPERIEPMVDYLKATIQQYIHRMIHDELTIQ